jgi:8-amino-7-oxononanoate synthase
LRKLESLLEWARLKHAAKRVLIVTESVFSMDGDRAPLCELVELKKRFGALLMLDEAHAVGVIAPNGRGLAATENASQEVDVQMGTLSKALGASGGYICGAATLIDWLINRACSFFIPPRRRQQSRQPHSPQLIFLRRQKARNGDVCFGKESN